MIACHHSNECQIFEFNFISLLTLNNIYEDNCEISPSDSFSASRRQLPQRKKAKIISEDFVDSDSVFDTKDDKISYSPYSSYNVSMRTLKVGTFCK